MNVPKKGVLLVNTGSPKAATAYAVWQYLTAFLNDPRVVDLPFYLRWPLINLLIVPFRFKNTMHAYQKIWQDGSPLLAVSEKMTRLVAENLGASYQVELAMRYGQPTIQSALDKLNQVSELTVLPLFPQYASASTGSVIEQVLLHIKKKWNIPALKVIRDFYDQPDFIDAYAKLIQPHLTSNKVDKVLFSYHGLPERHLTKSQCQGTCETSVHDFCYRAQCYATTKLIATRLNLKPEQYTVSFQSRLGRTPWIKPYTDLILPQLRQAGVNSLAVVCPSFVTDCLETLEEINIRARETWQQLGGQAFIFIPCLNVTPEWIQTIVRLVQ